MPIGLRQRATIAIRWTLLASVVTASTQLLQLVVLARFLSPDEFGLVGMLLIVVAFARSFTDLGLSAALIHRRDVNHAERSSLYWLNVLAGSVLFILALAAVPLVERIFAEPRLGPYLRVISVIFIIVPVGVQFEVLLQKELSFRQLGAIESVTAAAGAATTIIGTIAGFGLWAFVAGTVVMHGLKAAGLLNLGIRRFRPSLRMHLGETRSYLAFGVYQLGERALNFLRDRVDQLLVGVTLGTVALGFYSLAWNVTMQPISRINPIVTRVAFPALAAVQDSPERLRRGYLDMVQLLTTLNAPLLLGLLAVAPTFIPAVFGSRWDDSVVLVQLLCLVALARTVFNPMGSLALARGRPDMSFKWTFFAAVVTIIAVMVGAKTGGTTAVALALACLYGALQVLAFLFLIRPLIHVGARRYAGAIAKPIALAGAMAGTVGLVQVVGPTMSLGVLSAVQIGTGAIVYGAAVRWLEPRLFAELRGALTRRSQAVPLRS